MIQSQGEVRVLHAASCLQPSDVCLQMIDTHCNRLCTSSNLATLKCKSSYETITHGSRLPSLITLFSIPSESPWCKGSLHGAVSILVLMSIMSSHKKWKIMHHTHVLEYLDSAKGDWTPLISSQLTLILFLKVTAYWHQLKGSSKAHVWNSEPFKS